MRPVTGARITNPYGKRNRLYAAGYHTGVDFAHAIPGRNFTGAVIRCVDDGTIVHVERDDASFGRWVVVRSKDTTGTYVHAYCHMSWIADRCRVGAPIKRGEVIGKVGNSGNSSAPHLHYQENPGGSFSYSANRRPIHCYGRTWGTIQRIRAKRAARRRAKRR